MSGWESKRELLSKKVGIEEALAAEEERTAAAMKAPAFFDAEPAF